MGASDGHQMGRLSGWITALSAWQAWAAHSSGANADYGDNADYGHNAANADYGHNADEYAQACVHPRVCAHWERQRQTETGSRAWMWQL